MDNATRLPPPSSKRIAALLSNALEDGMPVDPEQRRLRREEISAFIWETFTRLSHHDRELWAHCVWHRRCLCSLAQRTGLSVAEVRDRLKATAAYLDQTCEAIFLESPRGGNGALGPGVTPMGTSARSLMLLLREGALHCSCTSAESVLPEASGAGSM